LEGTISTRNREPWGEENSYLEFMKKGKIGGLRCGGNVDEGVINNSSSNPEIKSGSKREDKE